MGENLHKHAREKYREATVIRAVMIYRHTSNYRPGIMSLPKLALVDGYATLTAAVGYSGYAKV